MCASEHEWQAVNEPGVLTLSSFKLGKLARPVGLALIVIPWFFRDRVAASFDEKSQEYQAVLTEQSEQQQAEAQAGDQRYLMRTLDEINLNLRKQNQGSTEDLDKQEQQLRSNSYKEDAAALKWRAAQLSDLAERVGNVDVTDAVKAAREVATALENAADDKTTNTDEAAAPAPAAAKPVQSAAAQAPTTNDLLDSVDQAEDKMTKAYDKLAEAAQKEKDHSDSAAGVWRYVAWFFTAIGGLLTTGWQSLFGGVTGKEQNA